MRLPLTEAEINDLLENGSLTIRKDIKWRPKNGSCFFHFDVQVENSYQGKKYDLTMVGTKNMSLDRYTFALLLGNNRIRGLCPDKGHINKYPQREKIIGLHKHKWTDQNRDSCAYVPTDITNTENIRQTFLEFCLECGIMFSGTFALPPETQPEFPLLD